MKTLSALVLSTALFASVSLSAAPVVQYRSGLTQVHLSTELTSALSSLGVHLGVLPDTGFNARRGIAIFPITSATVDLGDAAGEILHAGGLRLSAGATTVLLSNFVIDTTASPIELTGTVTANGDVIGRLPLFEIALGQNAISTYSGNKRLGVHPATVTLSQTAADALNQVFNVTAFAEGIPIGIATIDARSGVTQK